MLRVMDVVTGEVVDGPIDRARYSPVAWLPGGEAYYYVRRLAPELVPGGRGAVPPPGVAAPGRHRPRPRTSWSSATGRKAPSTTASRCRRDGRWLSRLRRPRAPRRATTCGSPTSPARPRSRHPALRRRAGATSTRRPASQVGRDGRLYVFTDRDAPRGRVCVTDPEQPDVRALARPASPRTPRRCSTASPSSTATSWRRRCCSRRGPGTRSASSPCTTCATGERAAQVAAARPRLDRRGRSSAPRAGTRPGSATPTTSTPASSSATTRAPARPRCGRARRAPSRSRRCARRQVDVRVGRRHRPCGCSCCRRSRRRAPDRPRPTILYGYGGFGLPLTPGYSATILAWVEAGGVYAIAEPARRRRGGRGLAPRRHARPQAERLRRLPRGGRVAGRRRLDDLASSWPSPAAPTAGCSSAPRSPSAPSCTRPSSARRRCWTWCATSSSGSARRGTSSTARADDPEQLRLAAGRTRRTTTCASGRRLPGGAVHGVRRRHPGRPAARPQDVRGPAARHHLRRAGPAPREADVGHGARALTRSVELSADMLAFTARWTGLRPAAASPDPT